MTSIPDFMPVLGRGNHKDPSQGACVMEYVSLLAGEAWSDSPRCTHPYLALHARGVNDRLGDDERQRLVPLIGRLFGTADDDDDEALWLGLETYSQSHAHGYSTDLVAFLTGLLDEYDRLTGRTETTPVDLPALEALRVAAA